MLSTLATRLTRGQKNYKDIYAGLTRRDWDYVVKICNKIELDKVLFELEMKQDDFLTKCAYDWHFAKVVAGRIARKPSRQSNLDKKIMLNDLKVSAAEYGVQIDILTPSKYIPIITGGVLPRKDILKENIKRDHYIKPFDAKISGPN